MTIASKIMARAKSIFAIAFTIIALSFASSAASAQNAQDTGATSPQQTSQVQDDVRNTLSQYGRFVQHQKYGEVWVPTVTPQGWHPYAPCHWVNTKQYGWYYDDKTPWGQIVHHYGRWVYDAQMGWIWTPGSEFSPGWVVWRTSPEWVGWAPMLPDQDVQKISASDYNNAGYWIFVETKKFAQGCNGTIAPPSQVPVLLKQTTYVTDIRYVGGIIVFVLPPYVIGPVVIIDINFGPWPIWFVQQILINWNFVWNNLVVVNVNVTFPCAPKQIQPTPTPVNNPQPEPPPSRPPGKPEGGNPPINIVNPICPIGTVLSDGACRLPPDPCRLGTVRVGKECLPLRPDPKPQTCPIGMVFNDGACRVLEPRPDPKPPIVVNNDPCAKLSGAEFQRCIRGGTPNIPIDPKPPGKGPVTGGGDVRPNPTGNGSTGIGSTGNGSTDRIPVGGTGGLVNPVKPNVILRPQFDGPKNIIRDNGPSNRLPTTTVTPMRSNPAGFGSGGGLGKTTFGASNAKVTPMTSPSQGARQTFIR
jgi:hypothetical protein